MLCIKIYFRALSCSHHDNSLNTSRFASEARRSDEIIEIKEEDSDSDNGVGLFCSSEKPSRSACDQDTASCHANTVSVKSEAVALVEEYDDARFAEMSEG